MATEGMTNEEKLEIVKKHTAMLMEHFDSVQIITTTTSPADPELAVMVTWGEGNWYARYGSVREWVNDQEAVSRRHAVERNKEQNDG